jgi:hypothetical protein
MDYQNELKNII